MRAVIQTSVGGPEVLFVAEQPDPAPKPGEVLVRVKAAGINPVDYMRSRAEDGAEVGRASFRFDQDASRIDKVVTLRTIRRGTTAELLGCHAD